MTLSDHPSIDWSDYQYALAVFEGGSHSAAAAALGVSQPTVSRRVRTLEGQLGTPLFERRDEGLVPTELGRLVLDRAARMREDAVAVERAAQDKAGLLSGEIVIAGSEGVFADWLPRALAPLSQRYPDLEITISLGFGLANLAAGDADIALRWHRPGDQQSLIARRVVSAGAGLYAAASYVARHGHPEHPGDLALHDEVAWSRTLPFSWPQSIDGAEVPRRRVVLRTSSPATHTAAIAAGLGIGLTTHRAAKQAGVELVHLLPGFAPELDLWLVAHERMRRSHKTRTVFEHLAEAIHTDKAHFRQGAPSIMTAPTP